MNLLSVNKLLVIHLFVSIGPYSLRVGPFLHGKFVEVHSKFGGIQSELEHILMQCFQVIVNKCFKLNISNFFSQNLLFKFPLPIHWLLGISLNEINQLHSFVMWIDELVLITKHHCNALKCYFHKPWNI